MAVTKRTEPGSSSNNRTKKRKTKTSKSAPEGPPKKNKAGKKSLQKKDGSINNGLPTLHDPPEDQPKRNKTDKQSPQENSDKICNGFPPLQDPSALPVEACLTNAADNGLSNSQSTHGTNNSFTEEISVGTPSDACLSPEGLHNCVNPPHSTGPTKVTPVSTMRAVVELNSDSVDYKSVVNNTVRTEIWKYSKFPNYDGVQGKNIKDWMRKKLGMGVQAFHNQFVAPRGIRSDLNNALRQKRAYTMQLMKMEFYGKLTPGYLFLPKPIFLLFPYHILSEYREYQDSLPENQTNDKKVHTRFDFLAFDVSTIGSPGNYRLQKNLDPSLPEGGSCTAKSIEVEKWENWRHFPNLTEVTSVTKGSALDLLSWLIHVFGLRVYFSRLKESEKRSGLMQKDGEDDILKHLTLDDFVFIFVQVQHNINKWNLVYEAWKKHHIDQWKDVECVQNCECDKKLMTPEEKKRLNDINNRGYEYPAGAGVAGTYGKKRYAGITKFLHRNYFSRKPEHRDFVDKNRKALDAAVKSRAANRRAWMEANGALDKPAGPMPVSKKSTRSVEMVQDEELDDIYNSTWDEVVENDYFAIV